MLIDLDLCVEEEFYIYASLLRLYKDLPSNGDREKGIIRRINERLYDEVSNYIYKCSMEKFAKVFFPAGEELQDYVNSAWEAVLRNFNKYNGKNKLTTFFKCYIDEGLRKQNEVMHGSTYYRKQLYLAQTDSDAPTLNAINALSIASPECIDTISYMQPAKLSVEDQAAKMLDWAYIEEISGPLCPYRKRLLMMYMGDICGYYGKHYNLSMICTDPELIALIRDIPGSYIKHGAFKFRRFDDVLNKYVLTNEVVEHISESFIKKELRFLRTYLKRHMSYERF